MSLGWIKKIALLLMLIFLVFSFADKLQQNLENIPLFQILLLSEAQFVKNSSEVSFYLAGRYFLSQGDYSRAIIYLAETNNQHPDNRIVPIFLGEALFFNDFQEQALAEWRSIGAQDFYYTRGKALNSEEYLFRAIQITPDFSVAYFALGDLYWDQQLFGEAVDYYQQGINQQANLDYEGAMRLARIYELKNEWDLAVSAYEKAALEEDYSEPFYEIGQIYYIKLHELDEALKWYKKAIQRKPNHKWSHYSIARIYLEKKDYQNAEFWLEKAEPIFIEFGHIDDLYGRFYAEQTDFYRANDYYLDAVLKSPLIWHFHYHLGENLIRLQQYEDAILSLQRANYLHPDSPKIILWLGYSHCMMGEENYAENEWPSILNVNPKYYDDVFEAMNNSECGIRLFEEVRNKYEN